MTGDKGLFASIDHYDNPTETIIYGDNGKGDVIGLGYVALVKPRSKLELIILPRTFYPHQDH
jgi:hypothetical protein